MRGSTLIALLALAFVRFSGGVETPGFDWRGSLERLINPDSAPTPDSGPTTPSEALESLVAPITAKLAEDRPKATLVATAFAGYADAMADQAGASIKTTGQWGQVIAAVHRRLGLDSGASIGSEVDRVLSEHVGIEREDDGHEDRNLTEEDRRKIVEAYRAISWAALQAK